MFDIKEYFDNDYKTRERRDIVNIDDDITHDITSLLSSRFDSLYRRDRYKHENTVIEIIHPSLQYPGNNSLLLNPDRVRYLLSFYPAKEDFANIDKIVLRPLKGHWMVNRKPERLPDRYVHYFAKTSKYGLTTDQRNALAVLSIS